MRTSCDKISVGGKTLKVPSACIDGRTVIVTGKCIKTAMVKDEDLCDGEAVADPELFVKELKLQDLKADIFTFTQRLAETARKQLQYVMEWDNAAVIPLTGYANWWEKRLPQETRRNVRKAAKMGVIVKRVEFDDELVRGIVSIYNETPIRQGRPFWHYGKDFATVKKENGTYLDRSDFIGAYYNDELIGFIKMVYAEHIASIMQILSKNEHYDKRPANALIAKAVEICDSKGMSSLVYCKYVYGNNDKSALTEFKRRNGFSQVLYPRYFVPLTTKGRIVMKLGLHHGLKELLPERLLTFLLGLRTQFFEVVNRKRFAREGTTLA